MATITVDRSINADDAFAMSAGIAFVALPSGSATYQTQATGITTWVTATIIQSSAWQAVCYGNNLVVAVSSTSGTIAASSPAGATNTWTLRTMPATASWYAIKYGLNLFVATSGGASTTGADTCQSKRMFIWWEQLEKFCLNNLHLGMVTHLLRKLDGNSNVLWFRQFGTSKPDSASGIDINSAGKLVVTSVRAGAFSEKCFSKRVVRRDYLGFSN